MEDDPFGDGGDAQVESTAQDDFFGGSNDNPDDNLVAEANFVEDDSEEEESVFDSVPADNTPQEQVEVTETVQQQPQKQAAPDVEENSKLIEWRKKWREDLEAKAAQSAQAKAARREAAAKELEAMEQMRTKARDAKFAKNRSDQLKFLEEIESKSDVKNPWEAVVSLIDLQPKSEDESDKNSRMKNLLIQMKAATSGPGIPA